MEISNIPFSQLPMLAKTDRAYAEQEPILTPFYKYPVDIQSFKQVIEDKSKDSIDRKTLEAVLKKQYKSLNTEGVVRKHINSISEKNTFTVVTAHQPSVFLGPLYFVYKIFSTIHLASVLKETYPAYNFVPVFVIGGEDHDFEEVNNITIFNKKITWTRSDTVTPERDDDKSVKGGAVGMMHTASLLPALAELKSVLGESENAQHIFNIIENQYTQNSIYQDATQALLNELFGKYGLVVLNMNNADLKKLFVPIMQREVVEQTSERLVRATQMELDALGFKSQAFPREINLFYLRENLRERIVFEDGIYKVLNTDYTWATQADLLNEISTTPQYFSPNVVLRPLYQEVVLPNLAYIGGGGELAYWLERKSQFEHFEVNFPMLIRRNSALILDKGSKEKLAKLNLQLVDIVGDIDIIIKKYIEQSATDPLSMEAEKAAFSDTFDAVIKKALTIDPTLEKAVLAEKAKALQSLDMIEGKLMKSEKQKHETSLNQIRNIAQKLFPNGGLQERVDNFLPYYIKYGEVFFDVLRDNLNPLQGGMVVISE
jgi:bacillithiol synthase